MTPMKCSKCWCPSELGHNVGCPDHVDANPDAQKDYDRGYRDGFDPMSDPLTGSQIARLPNKSYALGYRSGLNEINCLADDEAQARYM